MICPTQHFARSEHNVLMFLGPCLFITVRANHNALLSCRRWWRRRRGRQTSGRWKKGYIMLRVVRVHCGIFIVLLCIQLSKHVCRLFAALLKLQFWISSQHEVNKCYSENIKHLKAVSTVVVTYKFLIMFVFNFLIVFVLVSMLVPNSKYLNNFFDYFMCIVCYQIIPFWFHEGLMNYNFVVNV